MVYIPDDMLTRQHTSIETLRHGVSIFAGAFFFDSTHLSTSRAIPGRQLLGDASSPYDQPEKGATQRDGKLASG